MTNKNIIVGWLVIIALLWILALLLPAGILIDWWASQLDAVVGR